MDIAKGFQVDDPAVLIPWGISVQRLLDLFSSSSSSKQALRKVASEYYTFSGVALGLYTDIGFHFERNKLEQFELFDLTQNNLNERYNKYQSALVREFGQPTQSRTVSIFPPAHEWCILNYRILHFAQDRFGPESHLRILTAGSSFAYDPFSGM